MITAVVLLLVAAALSYRWPRAAKWTAYTGLGFLALNVALFILFAVTS